MTRNDAILNTGMTSQSIAKRVEKAEQKAKKRLELLPAGEIVKAEFQKEIYELGRIEYLNIEEMLSDEHFKAELMARKKTIEKLKAIQGRLNNILRETKDGTTRAADTSA